MPERIQLSRAKGWRMPPNTVRVARPGLLGNPWKVGNPGVIDVPKWPATYRLAIPLDQRAAVEAYLIWMGGGILWWMLPRMGQFTEQGQAAFQACLDEARSMVLAALPELRGKNLACWCKPGQPCHAAVLLELANR